MKPKTTALIASTMFALICAMPASATELNPTGQHLTGEQQSTQLLAGKGGGKGKVVESESSEDESTKGDKNPKKDESTKGGHSTGKSPSKQEKHQNGEAQRNEDQNVNPAFKQYKKNGGKLAKSAWQKQGMPKK